MEKVLNPEDPLGLVLSGFHFSNFTAIISDMKSSHAVKSGKALMNEAS